jgi:N-acetylglucosamine-6-phosphate deacetylase
MLALLTTLLGPERTVVVTDAQAVAGADGGSFDFAGQPVHVERGAARLVDGTLTGSVLTMDRALRNVLAMSGVGLREAVGMVTRNPARAARVDDRKGALAVGHDADLAILDEELRLCATLRGGSPAYVDGAWRERLAPLRRSGRARARAEVGARERPAGEPAGG